MKIGYRFKDDSILKRALTHSSKSELNYERLEFLGDSILDFIVGEYFLKTAVTMRVNWRCLEVIMCQKTI